jgi:hypothetical protein
VVNIAGMSGPLKMGGQHCRNDIAAAGNKTLPSRTYPFKKEVVRIAGMDTKSKKISGWSTSPEWVVNMAGTGGQDDSDYAMGGLPLTIHN